MAIPTALQKQDEKAQALAAKKGMRGVPTNGGTLPAEPKKPADPMRVAGFSIPGEDPVSPVPETVSEKEHRELEARHATLTGKYNAEVPRLSQQVKELTERLERMDAEKQRLEQQLQVAREEPPDWAAHIDNLGESLGDKSLSEVLGGLRQENVQLRNELRERDQQIGELGRRIDGVESVRSQDVETRMVKDRKEFLSRLEDRVPDYRQINRNQAFVDWMYEEDLDARRLGRTDAPTRQQILEEAAARLDLDAVIPYYNEFKALQQKGRDVRTDRLRQQIAPDESGASGTTLRSDKEIIPKSYVDNFLREVSQGRYNGKEEERRRIDQAIFEAQREGRIDPRR